MAEALRRAVEIGASGVRAYLRERTLGNGTVALRPDMRMRASEEARPSALAALLALAHLLRGEGIETYEGG
jgi:hypothetical protein